MKTINKTEALVNSLIEEVDQFFKSCDTTPAFYYRWGNEPVGTVSTGAYDRNDVLIFTGYYPEKITESIPFHNPHP